MTRHRTNRLVTAAFALSAGLLAAAGAAAGAAARVTTPPRRPPDTSTRDGHAPHAPHPAGAAASVVPRALPAGLRRAVTAWEVDREHSQVLFRIRHIGVTTVTGRFDRFAADVVIDSANPGASRVEARIEVASVNTAVPARDANLRKPEWFDAARFPTITFRSRAVRPVGPGRYDVAGDLTMHGVTRPVRLLATHNGTVARGMDGRPHAGFNATGTLDRTAYGVGTVRELPGGVLELSRDVELILELDLVPQGMAPSFAAPTPQPRP